MLPLAEAREYVLAGCAPGHPRAVPLGDALGLVTSVDLDAAEPVPPFDNTAMDGFAVRAADTAGASDETPVSLAIAGTLAAGAAPEVAVEPGQAVRIMTGAPMPPGADAVVMVERTTVDDSGATVGVHVTVEPGNHVRRAGDDVRAGERVFPAGTPLEAAHLGVLASVGVRRVPVHPRPRVGVVSTGDELVDGPEALGPGQIRDSNRRMLLALVERVDCTPVDLGRIPDDEAAIAAAFEEGARSCDAVISSGGVSMGDFDYVKVVLDRLGDMRWMQVAIRPAKPLAFGTIDGTPVFGLPGNPVSSLVSFELFARPGLRRMLGHAVLDRPRLLGVTERDLRRRPDGKVHFVRVTARYEDGGFRVRPTGGQGSHQLAATAAANALVVLPDGDGVAAGDAVEVLPLGDVGTLT
ncbi:MAG: molybdopterin molybdotransferase MoeA [Microthrixaceae bacterium]|nr:molybdopterin molybdotransferase MoeA [Microthrixaceae bacterium]